LRDQVAQITHVAVALKTETHHQKNQLSTLRTGARDNRHPVFRDQIRLPQRYNNIYFKCLSIHDSRKYRSRFRPQRSIGSNLDSPVQIAVRKQSSRDSLIPNHPLVLQSYSSSNSLSYSTFFSRRQPVGPNESASLPPQRPQSAYLCSALYSSTAFCIAAQAASGVSVPNTKESWAWKKAFTNSCGSAWSVGK
jgi:hypothetical protein